MSQEFDHIGFADEDVHAIDVDENAKEVEDGGETCECVALTDTKA